MTVSEFVISFIVMAVAVMTILVVGTIGAADLLHRPRRADGAEKSSDGGHPAEPEDAGARPASRQDSQRESVSPHDAEVVDALLPLGSRLSFVWHPRSRRAMGPGTDHEDPPRGRAA
ncbi:MAG TPA: hypothetical protein VFV89_08515 [Nocardioides sp.]|uniref:hypothetical protein n=1 Tax=Nocardioides sp. TaxID=35761 RepID=UPI002E2FDD4E|nr:hypothetical protein [Nocardioides sp.]HEX5087837.1 hypothetical protein [Nocardioides sp.]